MLLPWMLYSAAIAALLSLAALAVERILRWSRLPTRGAWTAAMAASLGFAAAAWLWPASAGGGALPELPSALAAPAAGSTAVSVDGSAAPLLDALRALGSAAAPLWAILTLVVLLTGIAAAAALRRERRGWAAGAVEGLPVLISERIGPAVVGLVRPVLVLPRWVLALPAGSRRLILAHEEQHRAARDPLLLFGAFLAAAAMPWSPALWWQLRRLRLAVEVDCDQRVLRVLPDRAGYGNLLLAVGARASGGLFPAPALTEPRSFLEERIRAMTTSTPSRHALRAGALGLASVGLLVLACEAPRPTEPVSPAMRGTQIAEREAARLAEQAEPRPVRSTATGKITGVVTDAETGQPLAGVLIWIQGPDADGSRGTITQTSGRYFIVNVPEGEYEMGFRVDGHATVIKKGVSLAEGVTRTVDARLPREP